MINIYGVDISPPVNKVCFAANAMGIAYQFNKVDLAAGEHKTPEYLKLHPAGKVPVMKDGDFVLFESNTICRYLADKANSALYPEERQSRFLVDQWMDFISNHIAQAMGRVFFNQVIYKFFDAERDESSLRTGMEFLERDLPLVDAQIEKKGYLAGDKISLADLCLLAHLDPSEVSKIDLSPYGNLTTWREGLKEKDFYTRCFADYSDLFKT